MTPAELLIDAFGRSKEVALRAVDGLDVDALAAQPGPGANSVGWLVWHLCRVQDDHVADVAGHEQVWTAQGFLDRFGLDLRAGDTGYGHSPADVAAVRVDGGTLTAYVEAVYAQTESYLRTLSAEHLDRVVDTRWDPPVTLGVRLVSVVDDDAQHAGQAAYVRGLLES